MGKQKKAKKKAGREAKPANDSFAPDAVDAIIAAWRREEPDLDVAGVGIVTRIARLSACFGHELEETFAQYGMTRASFEAMAALSRAGEPYRLAQAQLMQELSLTPGTVSVRVSRLAEEGLVERTHDPENRRGVIVSLTDAGRAAYEAAVNAQLETGRRLLMPLASDERETLESLLRRLLHPFSLLLAG